MLDWFKKKEPEDYEQVLASLALDIQKRQARLSDIRLRERRTTLLITLYTFAIWIAYIGAWYAGWRPLTFIPILVGPVIIQFSRRIAQTWYARIGNAEEKTLKELLSQQRSKVEEIKKKTNYYSTKNLLDRYDSQSSNSPARPRPDGPPGQPHAGSQQQVMSSQRLAQGQPNGLGQANRGQPPNMPILGAQLPQAPPVPPRKQWFDRLADALLGDDELGADPTKSRYALICQKCFAHNGLVKQELWEDTQYLCPKCGYFNPSMRALKAGHAGQVGPTRSPTSPQQQFQLHLQVQRRSAPRFSAPITSTGPLLQADESGYDRRRSLPAPEITTLTDEEEEDDQHHSEAKLRKRRSPLAQSIPLPEDSEDEDSDEEVEEVEDPRRRKAW